MRRPIRMQKKLQAIADHLKASRRLRIILYVIATFILFENLLLAWDNLQTKMPVLGIKLEDKNVSFASASKIKEITNQKFANLPSLKFTHDGQIIEIKKADVAASINPTFMVTKILSLGRTGNILQKIIYQNEAFLGLKSQKLAGNISESRIAVIALDLQSKIAKEATPPTPDFKNDPQKIIPAQDGLRLNTAKFIILISENFFNPPPAAIALPVEKSFTAAHTNKEVKNLASQGLQAIKLPVSISSGGLTFTLTSNDLKSLLSIVERPDPANPQKIGLSLRLNDVDLNRKLGEFATKVENITHAEFDDHDARVAIYSQFYSGKRQNIQIPTGRNLAYRSVLGEKDTIGEKLVYLTFDDGPNAIYHPLILDVLKAENVKATFFLVGNNTQKNQDLAQRTKAEGHVIGNHSLTHSFLPKLSQKAILSELTSTDDILNQINGKPITLFRPPYGGVNAYVQKSSDSLGLKLTLWDVDPKDWSEPTEDELVRRVVTASHNGADILLHSNHLITAKALPKIIQTLRSQGYSFKTLD